MDFPGSSSGKEPTCQCRRQWFDPWVWKIPSEKEMATHSVFLPGKFHGQRSLAGYSPWSHKETDMAKRLNNNRVDVRCGKPRLTALS